MDLLVRVREFIRRHSLLEPGEGLVAAVSGGADSLCLLDVLKELGYPVVVAHLDHGLRPESVQEAQLVAQVAQAMGLPLELERQVIGHGPGLEARARGARYAFLGRVAAHRGLNVVATGHTADDQAETVLMHLLRGTGPRGLAGMRPASKLPHWKGEAPLRLIRPLLEVRRSETEARCRTRGWAYITDPSNRDLRFLRNRIRHEVLPRLECINPRLVQGLTRLARLAAEQADLMSELVDELEAALVTRQGGLVRVQREGLLAQPAALQRELVRRLAVQIAGHEGRVGFPLVERVLELARGQHGSAWHTLGAGMEAALDGPWLLMRPEGAAAPPDSYPQVPDAARRLIPLDGRLRLQGRWWLESQLIARPPGAPQVEPTRALLALPGPEARLWLRPPQPGDRMRPLGFQGRIKLSDLFINEKIPQWARAGWPVVECQGEILWLPGLRVAEAARLRADAPVVELRLGGPPQPLQALARRRRAK